MIALSLLGAPSFPETSGMSVARTSASNPRSSIICRTVSGDSIRELCWTTALSMTKLTETSPAPAMFLKALSTADVHAPQVMPPTRSVVVVMCVAEGITRLTVARSQE